MSRCGSWRCRVQRHDSVTVLGEKRTLVVCVGRAGQQRGNWNVEKPRLQKNVEHHSKDKTGTGDEGTDDGREGIGG